MLRKLKTFLGFVCRGGMGIWDTLFDQPEISEQIYFQNRNTIGKTVVGEDIDCYTFGEGEEKILYFGGIHGNEIGTVKLMNRWVNFLGSTGGGDYISDLKDTKQIFVIPCLNIDGYKEALQKPEYFSGGRHGKANANNVDLNRNFPSSNWSAQSQLFAAGEYFDISGGTCAGSEPEMQALLGLIERENVSTIYAFHNCWGTVFGAGKNKESTSQKVESYSKYSGYRIFSVQEWTSLKLEQKTGHMISWAEEQNRDVIEVECRTRWGSGWRENKKSLLESVNL